MPALNHPTRHMKTDRRQELDGGVAERIRTMREARGWSQRSLADEATSAGYGTVTPATLAKVEDGLPCPVWMLVALADALDVTLDDVVPV